MSVCIRLTVVGFVVLAGTWLVRAEQGAGEPEQAAPAPESPKPPVQPEQPAPAPGPQAPAGSKQEHFTGLFSQWQSVLSELRQLKKEYPTADANRKTEIRTQFDQAVARGDALMPQLIEAAREAYGEAPGAAGQAGAFLLDAVEYECCRDNYEPALPLAEALVAGGFADKSVYAWAGLAALATGHFDAAEKHLQAAREKDAFGALGRLDKKHQLRNLGEFYEELISYYKQVWPKEEAIRQAEAKADDLPRVLLVTSKGEIELELFENEAPNTVANFVSLVEKGFYNGLAFHRVLAGFMAQGGCPKGDGSGGPGYQIPCECYQPNHRLHFRGTLSMAHAGRDTGGSQFFLTFLPTRHLDGVHTAFGRVVRGMEVLARLQRRDPQSPNPPQPDKIVEAKVLRKRNHEYSPKKTGE